jgi:two-component system OmpR family response regulator
MIAPAGADPGYDLLVMDNSPHILIVDDDREIRDLLGRFLEKHGCRVTTAQDGRTMRAALGDWSIDLIVLDLMLPGEDGLTLCRELRASSAIPIIMLTAMGEETDRIVGLEVGADDYVPPAANRPMAQFAGWTLDLARRHLQSPDGAVVSLTTGEFELLVAFIDHPKRVLSRDQLLDFTRGRSAAPFDRSIDIQVSRLRRKIEVDSATPELIKTVRSGGYIFTPAVERS